MTEYHDSLDPAPADGAEPPSGPYGMSRRQLLRHAGWFGGAVVLTVAGGEVISHIADSRESAAEVAAASSGALRFVQVSDSHIGFQGPANTDVAGSFTEA
ncbi:metallophosphoesterase, partial [Streptomyces sp. NPDC046197]